MFPPAGLFLFQKLAHHGGFPDRSGMPKYAVAASLSSYVRMLREAKVDAMDVPLIRDVKDLQKIPAGTAEVVYLPGWERNPEYDSRFREMLKLVAVDQAG
jgi:hypothetical protein